MLHSNRWCWVKMSRFFGIVIPRLTHARKQGEVSWPLSASLAQLVAPLGNLGASPKWQPQSVPGAHLARSGSLLKRQTMEIASVEPQVTSAGCRTTLRYGRPWPWPTTLRRSKSCLIPSQACPTSGGCLDTRSSLLCSIVSIAVNVIWLKIFNVDPGVLLWPAHCSCP